ncbi:Uncharacterised protein at_DN1706, partial [Pycnogonum litorale]
MVLFLSLVHTDFCFGSAIDYFLILSGMKHNQKSRNCRTEATSTNHKRGKFCRKKMADAIFFEILIEAAKEEYEWLYNSLHKSFKDTAMKKKNSWDEIRLKKPGKLWSGIVMKTC